MTTTTAANQGQEAVIAVDVARARSVVLHHAQNDADAAELLDMLGLADGQQDSTTPRCRGGLTGRPPGGVHALSAATEALLASTCRSANTVPTVTPTAVPAVAAPTARPDASVDRRCEGCGAPVVPQTRYKLDPDGYKQRGIKLFAAKKRCHACYYRLRRPAAAGGVGPEDPRQCDNGSADLARSGQPLAENPATPVDDNQPHEQLTTATTTTTAAHPTELDQANTELADLRTKLTDATKLIGELRADYTIATRDTQKLADQLEELSRERDQLAEQLRAATAHHCTWEWPSPNQPVKDCECGRPYPRNLPPFETEEVQPDREPWSELFNRIRDQLEAGTQGGDR
jgi:hypothetical protein